MGENIHKLEDNQGNTIYLDQMIGEGGQGAVFRTKDRNIAVKLLKKNDDFVSDSVMYDEYKKKIEEIMILKVDNDINICKPVSLLKKPLCGYVMKLLNNLEPVSNLIYLSDEESDLSSFLIKTNGLRKRLEVLIELSRTLARLHSKGIVYSDISPNNVFFAQGSEFSKVWLIDCDNMRLSYFNSKSIYTPGYGAPEIVNNTAFNSIFSDSFSFAILAFRLLTARSPFDYSSNGESKTGDCWDATITKEEISKEAFNWIGNKLKSNDELYQYIVSCTGEKLYQIFNSVFNKQNLTTPENRPTMRTWYDALIETYSKLNKCDCGHYHFANNSCLFCSNESKIQRLIKIGKVFNNEVQNQIIESIDNLHMDEEFFIEKSSKTKEKFIMNLTRETIKDIPIYDDFTLYSFNYDDFSIDKFVEPILTFNLQDNHLVMRDRSTRKFDLFLNKQRFSFSGERILNMDEESILLDKEKFNSYSKIILVMRYE